MEINTILLWELDLYMPVAPEALITSVISHYQSRPYRDRDALLSTDRRNL